MMDLEKSFECQTITDLIQAEAELQQILADFKTSSQHIVHVIHRWRPEPM
jgi:hypothetical protein